MKTLALLLLLPLFSYSQEYRIGRVDSTTFTYDTTVISSINHMLDSMGERTIVYDTLIKRNDSTLSIRGLVGNTYYSDIIRVKMVRDTVFTAFLKGGCYNSCMSLECGSCYKNATCECKCDYPTGSCESVNYGYSDQNSFSNIFREVWIESHGNILPEE